MEPGVVAGRLESLVANTAIEAAGLAVTVPTPACRNQSAMTGPARYVAMARPTAATMTATARCHRPDRGDGAGTGSPAAAALAAGAGPAARVATSVDAGSGAVERPGAAPARYRAHSG
jgi:hypothetical protein